MRVLRVVRASRTEFQCSSASRKFLNPAPIARRCPRRFRFSALQRAENSSMLRSGKTLMACRLFQCSSASRKFLNLIEHQALERARECFSALQRAENSSIVRVGVRVSVGVRFSALQRAENSSIQRQDLRHERLQRFQCSSASRKFLNSRAPVLPMLPDDVSVLFSEPKIPQSCASPPPAAPPRLCFSALQRAENSSIPTLAPASIHIPDCDDHASSFLSLPGASP